MKLKKVLLILICMMMTLSVFFAQTKSYAAETDTLYVKRASYRTGHLGYAINDPSQGVNGNTQTIWNLLSMKSATSTEYFAENEDGYHTLYCLDITKWMGNIGRNETSSNTVTYNRKFNMDLEKQSIVEKYTILGETVDGINNYNALLWLMDNIYVPNDSYYKSNEAEKRTDKLALLEAAGIEYDEEIDGYIYITANGDCREIYDEDNLLTDDDIEAVQQAVIWRYTVNNTEEQPGKLLRFDNTNQDLLLYYTEDGATYRLFSNISAPTNDPMVTISARDEQAVILYNYLTAQADNAGKNGYTSITTAPITINTTGLTEISTDNYKTNMKLTANGYVLGPVSIIKNNDLSYNIDLKVEDGNGNAITGYYFSDSEGTTLGEGKTVKDLVGQGDFYITVTDKTVEKVNVKINTDYRITDKHVWYNVTDSSYQPIAEPEIDKVEEEITITGEKPEEKPFDLSLRKYITKIEDMNVTNTRVPVIDEDTLVNGTTATYQHRKEPLVVKSGNIVTYNITVYNEGEKDGYATKIVDQLPNGLQSNLKTGDTVTSTKGNVYVVEYNITNNKIILTLDTTKTVTELKLNDSTDDNSLDSDTIELACTVAAKADSTNTIILTNIAYISEEVRIEEDGTKTTIVNQEREDRDSEPGTAPTKTAEQLVTTDIGYTGKTQYTEEQLSDSSKFYDGQQDDDDFEKIKIMPEAFDLKLIKFITEVNQVPVDNRVVSIDMSKLNTKDANGNLITTGDYKLIKDPVSVQKGDYATYTFRIYNEGDIAGYVEELSEDIPVGLEYVWAEGIEIKEDGTVDFTKTTGLTEEDKEAIEYNLDNGWAATENGYDIESKRITEISTEYLSKEANEDNLIDAYDPNANKDPYYKEISVMLKVVSANATNRIIRNEAAITDDCDSDGNEVTDRDSTPEEWKKEDSDKYYDEDKKWAIYKEDDEDYDNIILQQFDLALRKFITAVGEEEISTRVPEVNYEDGQITYEHDKTPVITVVGKVVTYTIRVYNEGNINGYAEKVSDDIPEYLEYLPENDINKEYRWLMYDEDGEETEDITKAERITTDYLSKENGEEMMEEDSSLTENPNLLKAFDNETGITDTNPDYRDLKVAFKVKDPKSSEIIITNKAQISDDADENGDEIKDIDSIPDEWNEGEDDQDVEHVKVQYFDLALRKYVTKAIVIENGVEEVRQTGHTPEMDPEPVVKVELHRKKLSEVTVKFGYTIRVTNEGEIAGYVKEITDYVPEGLKFVAEDNKDWKDEGNNVISTTLLENTLLQPGESAYVEVILTWINGADNIGLKVNTAEISKDYNIHEIHDIDSTPDNKIPGEDDIDDAPVILSIETGQARVYYVLGLSILITLASGIVIIKKFVM